MSNNSKSQSALFLENYSYYNDKFYTLVNVYGKYPVSERFSIVGFALVANVWGENLVGVNYQVNDWLQLEFKAGVETFAQWWRVSPMFMIRKNRIKYLFAYEYGGSGYWFTSRFEYNFDKIKISLRANRTIGGGPRIDFKIPKTDIYIWMGYTWEWNGIKSGPLLGINTTLAPKKKQIVTDPERPILSPEKEIVKPITDTFSGQISKDSSKSDKQDSLENPRFYVIVDTFNSYNEAFDFSSELKQKGIMTSMAHSKMKNLYYVIAGKYIRLEDANEMMEKMKSMGYNKVMVIQKR